MAFEDRTGGKYFNIYKGKFAIRTSADDPKGIARVNKNEKTVHEIYHDSFVGKLLAIRTKTSEAYGRSWEFDFKDGQEVYTLQLPYSNGYATTFLKILPNIDLSQEMKLQPDMKIVDGKTRSSLFISQNGTTLKHAYTKDVPNGLPNMVQVMVKGQPVWDDTDRLAFLEEMVNRDILPKLPIASAVAPASQEVDPLADEFGDPMGASDDGENDF